MKRFNRGKGNTRHTLDALREGSASPTVRVLLAEDSPGEQGTSDMLRKYDPVNFDVDRVRTTDECSQALARERPALLLLDDSLPGASRLTLLRRLAEAGETLPVIMLTGPEDEGVALEAMSCGAYGVIRKDSADYLTLAGAVHQSLLRYHREEEESRALAELDRLTVNDGLTGLHSKRYLLESLDRECRRVRRYGNDLSFLMIDLDDFRFCNESHGQRAGDEMLRRVAELFKKSVREADVLARYGGEEFCLILPETGFDGAMQAAERLRFEVAARRLVAGEGSEPLTVSIGVYTPRSDEDLQPEEIVANAEAALREAKAAGKNKVCGRAAVVPGP